MNKPMRAAVNALHEVAHLGTGLATPEQILAIATKFDVEPSALEGFYLDDCDRIASE